MIDKGNGPFNPKLKTPKNLRPYYAKICVNCVYLHDNHGFLNCIRPDDLGDDTAIAFDSGDLGYFYTTCDRYKEAK